MELAWLQRSNPGQGAASIAAFPSAATLHTLALPDMTHALVLPFHAAPPAWPPLRVPHLSPRSQVPQHSTDTTHALAPPFTQPAPAFYTLALPDMPHAPPLTQPPPTFSSFALPDTTYAPPFTQPPTFHVPPSTQPPPIHMLAPPNTAPALAPPFTQPPPTFLPPALSPPFAQRPRAHFQ